MLELFGTIILGCVAAVAVMITGVFVFATGKSVADNLKKNKTI